MGLNPGEKEVDSFSIVDGNGTDRRENKVREVLKEQK